MANYYSDSSEWKWLLKHAFDWKNLIPIYYSNFPTEEGFKSTEDVINFYEELLSSIGDWSANAIRNRAKALDVMGAGTIENGQTIPSELLKELYREATELGFFSLIAQKKFGGMHIPSSVMLINLAMTAQACQASTVQLGFFTSIIDMVERFCDDETQKRIIPQFLQGTLSGAMCLTEPGAGSDVGAIKTSATPIGNGKYLLNGTKCFISNGGGGVGFILARIKGAPEGLEGISLFFAEEWLIEANGNRKHNYYIGKNEEKMGLHGSFTCEIIYENSQATLVGEPHQGFQYMLHLMNEARIAVGMQTLGGVQASLEISQKYAMERRQFGRPIGELPLLKRILSEMKVETDAFRALMVDTAVYFDIYQKLDFKKRQKTAFSDDETKLFNEAKKWTRRRTPLVKYYGAEMFTKMSKQAIQVHGGYGMMKDYDAERLHRDSFAPLLYEGTSQIQALMAMKDLLKDTFRNPTKFVQSMLMTPHQTNLIHNDISHGDDFKKIHFRFKRNIAMLLLRVLKPNTLDIFNAKSWQDPDRVEILMMHAENICQGLAYIETLRVLSRHAQKDSTRKQLFDNYHQLVGPRLEAIYADWKIFDPYGEEKEEQQQQQELRKNEN